MSAPSIQRVPAVADFFFPNRRHCALSSSIRKRQQANDASDRCGAPTAIDRRWPHPAAPCPADVRSAILASGPAIQVATSAQSPASCLAAPFREVSVVVQATGSWRKVRVATDHDPLEYALGRRCRDGLSTKRSIESAIQRWRSAKSDMYRPNPVRDRSDPPGIGYAQSATSEKFAPNSIWAGPFGPAQNCSLGRLVNYEEITGGETSNHRPT